MQHTAIYDPLLTIDAKLKTFCRTPEYKCLIDPFSASELALFSPITLKRFIEEEAYHENYQLSHEKRKDMRHCSSGEQRKALFQHLLNQNPRVIILDNPFDTLDVETQNFLKHQINELSNHIIIIQILKRKEDLIDCIQQMLLKDDEQVERFPIEEGIAIIKQQKRKLFSKDVPAALEPQNEHFKSLLRFQNVNVSYEDRPILQNINWSVYPGEFWQLTGPNGSGKSTILTMINGDNPKAFGQNIYLFDKKKGSGETVWDIKKRVGYFTPSMMDLFSNSSTALEMIGSGLTDSIGLYHTISKSQLELAKQWLSLLELEAHESTRFIDLSQKEQRMVLIARAMIKHPHLLILDEPNIGLDDESAHIINTLIQKMSQESNTAILYVSHRKESGIQPEHLLVLQPSEMGSKAEISHFNETK